MNYFLYILFSKKLDRYYIGATKDISTRMQEHLWHHRGFTSKANDWVVVYQESFQNKGEALKREIQIKKWKSRKLIEKLISSKEE